MTVHRTLNRAKPFTPQGEGERDEKKEGRVVASLFGIRQMWRIHLGY